MGFETWALLGLWAWASMNSSDNNPNYREILSSYSNTFPNNPEIQQLLNKKIEEFLKDFDHSSHNISKAEYIWIIISDLKDFVKRRWEDHPDETKKELTEFKLKLEKFWDKSTEWKIKSYFEYLFLNYPVKRWEKPFYVDKNWKLKRAIIIWSDKTIADNVSNPQELAEKLNNAQNEVEKLVWLSQWPIKKQIGILYDVAMDPKNALVLYKHELMDQPWYKEKLKENWLDK